MGLKDFLNEVASGLDSGSIQQKVTEIQQKIANKEGFDLGSIQQKLAEIQQKVMSKEGLDLGSIQQKLAEIQQKVANKEGLDLGSIQQKLAEIQQKVANKEGLDLGSLQQKLAEIQQKVASKVVFASTPAAETYTDNNDTNSGAKMPVFAVGAGSNATNIFFPSKTGMALTTVNNDAKGNAESYSVLTVKDVDGLPGNMTITYGINALDKNRNPLKGLSDEMTYQVVIKDGVTIMDINQMIPAQVREQGALKMEVTGTPMEMPGNLQPGQSLKDSEITIAIDVGIMKVNTVVKTEGKYLAIEDVKVPAGTFKCHKITQKTTTTAMIVTTTQTTVSWYAPNIGTVKTVTYDDKNNLVSSSELVELKGK